MCNDADIFRENSHRSYLIILKSLQYQQHLFAGISQNLTARRGNQIVIQF